MSQPQKFQYLDSLIGGWFNQDYDMDGGTLEAIMDSYKNKAKPSEQAGLLSDVRLYLAEHPTDPELEEHFYKTFRPEFVEGAWGISTREFLKTVESSLQD